jgi:ferrochelatase
LDSVNRKLTLLRYHVATNTEVKMARGILLLNMGGPNNIGEVELFLRNMFSDPRILPLHPVLRRLIGRRIIRKRLHEAEENYRQLGGKSPLTEITRSLAEKIEKITGLPTRMAMRYVPPFSQDALKEFQTMGIDEMVAFPMYPHYSTTTTRSSLDDLEMQMERLTYHPDLTVVEPYYEDPVYAQIVVDRIMAALGERDANTYDLILSAHGLPMRIIHSGDPYQKHVETHVRVIKELLEKRGVHFQAIRLAYQSKVGSGDWLEPNLIDLLRRPENLNVMIFPLAFTIDNSETRFELDIEHREVAEKIGYAEYRVATCPNDEDAFAQFIAGKVNAAIVH